MLPYSYIACIMRFDVSIANWFDIARIKYTCLLNTQKIDCVNCEGPSKTYNRIFKNSLDQSMVINYLQKEKDGGDEECWDLKQRKNECSDHFPIFSEI